MIGEMNNNAFRRDKLIQSMTTVLAHCASVSKMFAERKHSKNFNTMSK